MPIDFVEFVSNYPKLHFKNTKKQTESIGIENLHSKYATNLKINTKYSNK